MLTTVMLLNTTTIQEILLLSRSSWIFSRKTWHILRDGLVHQLDIFRTKYMYVFGPKIHLKCTDALYNFFSPLCNKLQTGD